MCHSLIGKFKNHCNDYNQENGTDYSLRKFMVDVLQYSDKDVTEFFDGCTKRDIERRKKKEENIKKNLARHGMGIKNANYTQILKYLLKDDTKDEYKKYYDKILKYSEYLKDDNIMHKKSIADFLRKTYNIADDIIYQEVGELHDIIFILKDLK